MCMFNNYWLMNEFCPVAYEESVCCQNILLMRQFLCSCVLYNQSSGSVLHRRTVWHSRYLKCPPVALRIPVQKCNISLFHFLTMAGSAAFCMEMARSHYDRFFIQCWLQTSICYAKCHTVFLGILIIASCASLTASSIQTDQLHLCPFAHCTYFLFHRGTAWTENSSTILSWVSD